MDQAFDYYLRGWTFYLYFRRRANAEARRLYQEAIKLNPDFARAYADYAYSLLHAWVFNWDKSVTLQAASDAADKAMSLDQEDYYNNWIRGAVHLYSNNHAAAESSYNMARNLAKVQAIPEDQRALTVDWGEMLTLTNRAKQAIPEIDAVIKASPFPEKWFHWVLGWAYYEDGQYQSSLDALAKIGYPRNAIRKNRIANLVALGNMSDAEKEAGLFVQEEALDGTTYAAAGQPVFPGLSIVEDRLPFQDPNRLDHWKNLLAQAFKKQVQP